MAAAVTVHEHPGRELPQLRGAEPRGGGQLRPGGAEQGAELVETEAVHLMGGEPAAHGGGRLQNTDADSGAGQQMGR